MGQDNISRFAIIASVLALAFSVSCKVEDPLLPTGPADANDAVGSSDTTIGSTPTSSSGNASLTAPIISDPLPGSTVSEAQPELTVLNAAHEVGVTPTYLFQVSSESSFASLVAQSIQVSEGADGKTSWIVDRPLSAGRYFWRARARAGTVDSSFSDPADFSLGDSGTSSTPPPPEDPTDPAPPPGGAFLYDPLVGGSVGEVSGGQFTSTGWRVASPADYIRYEVPTLERGWVEFDTTGMREVNPSPDQFMLFGMWDPSSGPYRANPFRVHLQKLHPNPHNPPYLRVRWIAQGEQHDEGSDFAAWNPSHKYHWRLDWGPSGDGHSMRVRLDGDTVIQFGYRRAYRPGVHWIELGIAERSESIVGVTYSDMQIGN